MTQSNWTKVYATKAMHKAEITKYYLEEEGITCVLVNKKDTAYGGVFGEIEIFVQGENVMRAKHILSKKPI